MLERRVNGSSIHAAVFDRLERGVYTLWHRGEVLARGVSVFGGEVAELDGRTLQPTSSR